MISPKNPGVKGDDTVWHDGRTDADHESEVKKAESKRGGEQSGRKEAGVDEPDLKGKI